MIEDDSPSERHNRLAGDFATNVIREVVADGGGYAEVMVVLESVMLGAMLANSKVFGLSPQVSSGLVEAAVQRALERYLEQVR